MEKETIKSAKNWFFTLLVITILDTTYESYVHNWLAFGLIIVIQFPFLLYFAKNGNLIDEDNGVNPSGVKKKGVSDSNPFKKTK